MKSSTENTKSTKSRKAKKAIKSTDLTHREREEGLSPEGRGNLNRESEETSNRMTNGSSSLVNTENRQTANGNRSGNSTESESLIKLVNRESFGNGTTNITTTDTANTRSYDKEGL